MFIPYHCILILTKFSCNISTFRYCDTSLFRIVTFLGRFLILRHTINSMFTAYISLRFVFCRN
jgi:hypothetical protein